MKRRGFLRFLVSAPAIPSAVLSSLQKDTYVEIDGKVTQGIKLELKYDPAAPAYSFTSDPDTGFYRVGADKIGISVMESLSNRNL